MPSYRQFCALARSLDLVGQRWTLLIVRELMLGPRRYGELLEALPGIGTNLLAARLEALCANGVCERDGRRYALGARGQDLEETVLALARWGMSPMAPPVPGEHMRPDWYAVAMLAAYRRPSGRVRTEEYEFDVGGEPFHLTVGKGRPRARRGSAVRPAFRLSSDLETFLGISTGAVDPGRSEFTGSRAAVGRWLAAFGLPAPVPDEALSGG